MPAGKAARSGGFAKATRLHFGISIRSLRRYAKKRVAIPGRADAKELRQGLRFAFRIYMIDCASPAPTGTQRRKSLRNITAAAARLISRPNRRTADDLLTALDTPDLDARKVAYSALTAKGYEPLEFKRRLRHWRIAPSTNSSATGAANELASLNVEALAPVGGRFPDSGLARLIASLVPIWTTVTGRTAGLISASNDDVKTCPLADWLHEMLDLLGLPRPPVGRVVDIVRLIERAKNPAPVTSG